MHELKLCDPGRENAVSSAGVVQPGHQLVHHDGYLVRWGRRVHDLARRRVHDMVLNLAIPAGRRRPTAHVLDQSPVDLPH